MTKTIYISVDIKSDGPNYGKNSMLSLGADARFANNEPLGLFSSNIEPLPFAHPDTETMQTFWAKHPQAWQASQKNQRTPQVAMAAFAKWVLDLEQHNNSKAVFVAYPLWYDYGYVDYYFKYCLINNPFEGRTVDIRSMIMGLLGVDYNQASKHDLPAEWELDHTLTHIAVEDATKQAGLFFKVREASFARLSN